MTESAVNTRVNTVIANPSLTAGELHQGRCRGSADLAGFIPKSYGVRGKLLRKYIYRGMVPSVQLVTMNTVILQAT